MRRTTLARFGVVALLLAASAATLAPLSLSVAVALTPQTTLERDGVALVPSDWTMANFGEVLRGTPFGVAALVTVAAAALLTVTQVATSAAAAFVFAKIQIPGREILFGAMLLTYLVPPVVTIVPVFLAMTRLGLKDTFWGIVIPFLLASPFAVFLLRQYFRAIPDELIDAARLDGATMTQVLCRIVVPLSRPALAIVALITAIGQWNAFLWPRLISGSTWPVVTVAVSGLRTQYDQNWGLVLAGTTMALLPALGAFALSERQLVHAVAAEALR
ncbi:carbohydrate ABC transporter permease [Microbacterium sp. ARD31]|uniref:carbohydrate ABC transporter permease n=1 Tax=Microbacterium sp. ARD31 TaxID=2962576 RepID=UPI00288269CE|nr:carbohydrate ABC transporter permease [Microbacterium sp. ARD31]MDT0183941.1 carbohydrate ABC transporter permease [Microbacterium sp. ARD31]